MGNMGGMGMGGLGMGGMGMGGYGGMGYGGYGGMGMGGMYGSHLYFFEYLSKILLSILSFEMLIIKYFYWIK